MRGEIITVRRIMVGKPEGKGPHGKRRRRWRLLFPMMTRGVTVLVLSFNNVIPLSNFRVCLCQTSFRISRAPKSNENWFEINVNLSPYTPWRHWGGLAPIIRNLGTRWRPVLSFTTRPLIPTATFFFHYPLSKRLGGSQKQSACFGGQKIFSANRQSNCNLGNGLLNPLPRY